MSVKPIQYQYKPENFRLSEPNKYQPENLKREEMILSLGPQHPSTHGVLRIEVITDGELVVDVVPHLGYTRQMPVKQAT